MTTIVTRASKASPLSWVEMDSNLENLNNDKIETSAIGTTVQAYSANLDTFSGVVPTIAGIDLLEDASVADQRTTLNINNVDNTSDATKNSATATLTNKTLTTSGGNSVEAISGPDSSQLSGFRNKIINGDMRIWQRGVQITTAGYFLDRWQVETFGTGATGQYATQGDSTGTDMEPYGQYNLAVGRTAGTSLVRLSQRIENARTLAGKVVTLSFVAKATAGSVFIYPRLYQKFGTGGSPSADTNSALSACELTTTTQRFVRTVTLPSIVGKTFGSNKDSSLSLVLDSFDSGGFDIRITNVQLEEGSIAIPFEHRPIGLELSLCQRYYEVVQVSFAGNVTASTTYNSPVCYKVEKRATPTVTSTGQSGQLNGSFNTRSAGNITTLGCTWGGLANATIAAAGFIDNASVSAEL